MRTRPPASILTTFVAALSFAAPAFAEREDVERVFAAMEKAVLAGDPGAYLVNVVAADGPHADPVFRKEQENWAADLKLHAPEVFDLAVAEPAPERPEWFNADRAEFEMTMSWRMPAGGTGDGPSGAGGKDRKVSFPVVFIRSAEGEWLYAGERWASFDSKDTLTRPDAPAGAKPVPATRAKAVEGLEEVAERVLEVMPEVRAHVQEGFELTVWHTQEVKIYADMRHLQASIYLSYSDPLGGWNEPGESIKLLARPRTSKGSLRQLLAHEFGHVATFEMGSKASDIAWWVIEGVAELSAEKYADNGEGARAFVRARAKADSLAPWNEMADFRKTPDKWMSYVYKQGEHMVQFVSAKGGRAGRNAWIRAMAQGATIDDATRTALGMSFEELDKAWRASITEELAQESKAEQPKAEQPGGEEPKAQPAGAP